MLVPIGLAFTLGWREALPRQWRSLGLAAVGAFLLCFNAALPVLVLRGVVPLVAVAASTGAGASVQATVAQDRSGMLHAMV